MDEVESLRAELEHYKQEKGKIRDLIGQAGGQTNRKRVAVINVLFLVLVFGLFFFDVARHLFGWNIPFLPQAILLETAVLLVSVKIIWMIHVQTKVEHFQFFILNSIEFQLNMLSRRFGEMQKTIDRISKNTEKSSAE